MAAKEVHVSHEIVVVSLTLFATYEKKSYSSAKPLKAVIHGLHEDTNEISRLHNSVGANNVLMLQFKYSGRLTVETVAKFSIFECQKFLNHKIQVSSILSMKRHERYLHHWVVPFNEK